MTIIGAAEREIARGIQQRIIDRALAEQEHSAMERKTQATIQQTNDMARAYAINELQKNRDAWKDHAIALEANIKAWANYAKTEIASEQRKRESLSQQWHTVVNAIKAVVRESQQQFIDEARRCPNTEHHSLVLGKTDEQIFEKNNAKIDELIRQSGLEPPSPTQEVDALSS